MLQNNLIQESPSQIFEFVEEKLGLGLWLWDYRARRMQWSRGTYKLLQLDYGSVEPSFDSLRAMIHPDDAGNLQYLVEVMDRQFSVNREFRIILRDKRVKWFQSYGELSTSRDGSSQMIGFLLDITARKEKEMDLHFIQERSSVLERDAAVSFWTASRDGVRINITQWTEWTGQDVADMQNHGWLNCVHPADRERVSYALHNAIRDGSSFVEDYRLRLRDGRYVEVAARGALITNPLHVSPEWTGVILWRNALRSAATAATISGAQIRAARALLGWTAADLAKASGTSISSIRRIEDNEGVTQTRDSTLEKIRRALETAGVDFMGSSREDQIIRLRATRES